MGFSVLFSQLGFGFPKLGFSEFKDLGPWGLGELGNLGALGFGGLGFYRVFGPSEALDIPYNISKYALCIWKYLVVIRATNLRILKYLHYLKRNI